MQSRIKNVIFKMTAVALSALAYAAYAYFGSISRKQEYYYEPGGNYYAMAARAILGSDMWFSDKTDALEMLLPNGTAGYYQSIIAIVSSSMWSSDKLDAIEGETAKFKKTV